MAVEMTRSSVRFRFSLRLCLLLVCLASVLFAWIYWRNLLPPENPGQELYFDEMGHAEQAFLYDTCWTGDYVYTEGATSIDDSDLARISKRWTLKILEVRSMYVTDLGVAHLAKLRNLKHLTLNAPNVTDEGLVHLSGLDKLSTLNLRYCAVTDKGVAKLQAKLPDCEILY